MIFYLFILNVNFLLIPAINEVHLKERLNPANKILIISTLVFFYYMPILLEGYVFKLLKRLQNFKNILITVIFFISSLFYFLEFKKKQKYQYCIYNTVLLILSSYISPNFAVFFLYFFYYYFKHYHL